jgi:PQQ-dependent dehydrogenase (methanol/ethanol family)
MRRGARQALAALLLSFSLGAQSAPTEVDWPLYGRDAGEQRYSPLDQITPATVSRLGLAWYYQLDTDRGQEATPIMVDGVIYTSTAWSKVVAFDARSGKLLWEFDPKVPVATLPRTCCDAVNRGAAVAGGRVFVCTLDGRLIALDAKTGHALWSTLTVEPGKTYSSTGAVRVVKDKVLIGNSGAEFGVRGYVSAYDAATGKLAWRFYVTPNPDGKPDGAASDKVLHDKAAPTWFGDGWKQSGGGGSVWDSMSYDPQADLLYFGTDNGVPYDRARRSDGKGDNLFIASIVAVRPETGEYVWHYQVNPGDEWDYSATQHLMLADLTIDGKPRKVLMQAPKDGFFYVLDRLTGKLISAKPFVDVNWTTGIDLATGRPEEEPGIRWRDKPWTMTPGGLGAHVWHPMAFDPKLGLVYIPAQSISNTFARDDRFTFRPGHENTAVDTSKLAFPDDPAVMAAIKAATYGELIAWDPVAQKRRWSVKHSYFFNGGVLATAGGLVFQGTAEGDLVSYDSASGQKLWSYPAVNGIMAPPITYAIDGKQYVAVMVGYGAFAAMIGTIVPDRPRLPGRLMVFALDGKAAATAYDIPPLPLPELAGVTSSGDPVAGLAAYNDTCLVCHGFSATGRFTADLRRSQILHSPETWRDVVLGGALADRGMVSFAKYVSPEQAENIRAYVLREARKLVPPAAPPKP